MRSNMRGAPAGRIFARLRRGRDPCRNIAWVSTPRSSQVGLQHRRSDTRPHSANGLATLARKPLRPPGCTRATAYGRGAAHPRDLHGAASFRPCAASGHSLPRYIPAGSFLTDLHSAPPVNPSASHRLHAAAISGARSSPQSRKIGALPPPNPRPASLRRPRTLAPIPAAAACSTMRRQIAAHSLRIAAAYARLAVSVW